MIHRGSLFLLMFALSLVCTAIQPGKVPQREDEDVTVVAEPTHYVIGANSEDELHLFKEADSKRMWRVDGIILEVVRPPEYAGRIIGMHHDGVLASGDPYKLWEIGRQYEFGIPRDVIGKLSFGPCSLGGTRKVLPK
jgi:hypothetical protein